SRSNDLPELAGRPKPVDGQVPSRHGHAFSSPGTCGRAHGPALDWRLRERSGVELQVIRGQRALDGMAEALDDLHAATATPVTARRPWLQTWLSCFPEEPLIVAVWSGERLEAVAPLAQHRRLGITETVAMGNG